MSELKIALALTINPQRSTHGMRLVVEELLAAAGDDDQSSVHLITAQELFPERKQIPGTVIPAFTSDWRRLQYEQFELPRLVEELVADALLVPFRAGPMGSSVPLVILDLLSTPSTRRGLGGRFLKATRLAAAQGAQRNLIFKDLSDLQHKAKDTLVIDPWVSSNFQVLTEPEDRNVTDDLELPSSYVLASGVVPEEIPMLLAAWTWVDGSVGDSVPLAVIIKQGTGRQVWRDEIERMNLGHSIILLDRVRLGDLPALLRRAMAYIHAGTVVQPQIMRWAMACGVPVVGFESQPASSVLGSAGYLVPPGDTRALGAACLTVIVEPEVRERLRQQGLLRARVFHASLSPLERIRQVVQDLAAGA
jgi:glycosyltransferase involved in cell wall biosynthesis